MIVDDPKLNPFENVKDRDLAIDKLRQAAKIERFNFDGTVVAPTPAAPAITPAPVAPAAPAAPLMPSA
mgnify:CR=1 FL=1